MSSAPRIFLLNIGSELMVGRILNSHLQSIGRELWTHHFEVARQIAVGDDRHAMRQVFMESAEADVVLVTGGLGPTCDDLTREVLSELLQRSQREDPQVQEAIQQFFQSRGKVMLESTRVQALVPEGAFVLPNAHGTAPGLWMPARRSNTRLGVAMSEGDLHYVLLPGPPRELLPMLREQVIPQLESLYPDRARLSTAILRTTGLGESIVEERITPCLREFQGLDLALCARVGEVEIRLTGRDRSEGLVSKAAAAARAVLGEVVYGTGDETLEFAVVQALRQRHCRVAVAESCTGGFLANRLTHVPGSSEVFWGGIISYSNDAKQRLLGVSASTLEHNGAVSREAAAEMATGIKELAGTDFGIAVTGIAGPGGGTPEKPVGTVFIGLASPVEVEVESALYPYDRETFKFVASQQALDQVRRWLKRAG